MFPNVKKKVKILTVLTTISDETIAKQFLYTYPFLSFTFAASYSVTDKTGWLVHGKMPFLYTTTQQFLLFCRSISNKLLCEAHGTG